MAISCTSSVICARPRPAFLRIGIGVEPVWLSLPVTVHFDPAQALAVGDDADVLALGLQDRALLDVQLEEGVHLAAPTSSSPFQPMRSSSSPKRLPLASTRS
jgi:hypothetical protein